MVLAAGLGLRLRPITNKTPKPLVKVRDRTLLDHTLDRLVAAGNTVVLVEHNPDVLKCADWLIDLGPEGGAAGGRLVAEGPPERVAATPGSHTGAHLGPLLDPHR